jgi:integrase
LKSKLKGDDKFRLDFIAFAYDEVAHMKKSTAAIYTTAFNALKRYIKRDTLDIFEINKEFLKEFEKFIENEPSQCGANRKTAKQTEAKGASRAVSAYLTYIRAMYNRALEKYNDEERGIIRIPYYPFKKFKIRQPPKTRKRALSIAEIQKIIDLPTKGRRHGLARDCFLISLGLIGMNSADLYFAEPAVNNIVIYQRQKTKGRRDDQAEMRVQIEPCIASLVEKHSDTEGKRLFSFYRKYSDMKGLNKSINKGLKLIGEELEIEDLEYYAARHSWATIAQSRLVGIGKATIHEALNHVDDEMKVTDIYIDRDWSVIWEANKKVLAMFDWGNVLRD